MLELCISITALLSVGLLWLSSKDYMKVSDAAKPFDITHIRWAMGHHPDLETVFKYG